MELTRLTSFNFRGATPPQFGQKTKQGKPPVVAYHDFQGRLTAHTVVKEPVAGAGRRRKKPLLKSQVFSGEGVSFLCEYTPQASKGRLSATQKSRVLISHLNGGLVLRITEETLGRAGATHVYQGSLAKGFERQGDVGGVGENWDQLDAHCRSLVNVALKLSKK